MKRFISLLFFVSVASLSFGQEDCADGIDNDADGDIDLNDSDCDCAGLGLADTLSSLIPNPSFEDYTCCPSTTSELSCAVDWEQASTATSDYYNTCGFTSIFADPAFPLPGAAGGAGYAGFYNGYGGPVYKEYVGACLDGPLLGGTPYVLNVWLAWSSGSTDLEFAIYGTPDCADMPWGDWECPVGEGAWELLDITSVSMTTDGAWTEVTMNFTPTVDIDAVALGADCGASPASLNYYFIDELTLIDSLTFSGGAISQSGDWCNGDLALNVDIDTVGGAWQWYLNGVALVGETSDVLDVMGYGAGTYQAVYTVGGECEEVAYTLTIPAAPIAEFSWTDQCDGTPVDFTDESTIGFGAITDWDWDFGDSNTSTDTDPTHPYAGPGTYTVDLTVTSDSGCQHTISHDVEIFPIPVSDFEFEVNGESSATGTTGGCIFNVVSFLEGASVVGGTITDYDWDFGDGNTSTDANPTHTYAAAGLYTVTLTVTTADGCQHTFQMNIDMTDSPTLDIIASDPSCWGFTDGSVNVTVTGGSPSLVIEITDTDDNMLNIGGSNAANLLPEGWYYIFVDDGSGCVANDSVYLNEPEALTADLDLTMPLCNGDQTGIAVVDTVYNAQGDLTNITFIWAPDPQGVSGLLADSSWGLGAGTYTVTINDDNGCANEITFEITEPTPLVFAELGYDPAYCRLFPYQSGNGVVFAAAGGGTADYIYQWLNLSDSSFTANSTWGGLNPADYEITITDDNGCQLIQVITVEELDPIADFDVISAELDLSLQGTATVCAEFVNQSLYFANPNNPLADTTFWWNLNHPQSSWFISHDYFEAPDTCYDEGGLYEVCLVAQNKNGCTDTTCKTITVFTPLDITPPNIFTPNGDGFNDEYTFTHLAKGVATFHVVIVNRWGTTMAEIHDIDQGWDGTDKSGSTCRDGVYFFTYDGTAENGDSFAGQGTIELISGGNK